MSAFRACQSQRSKPGRARAGVNPFQALVLMVVLVHYQRCGVLRRRFRGIATVKLETDGCSGQPVRDRYSLRCGILAAAGMSAGMSSWPTTASPDKTTLVRLQSEDTQFDRFTLGRLLYAIPTTLIVSKESDSPGEFAKDFQPPEILAFRSVLARLKLPTPLRVDCTKFLREAQSGDRTTWLASDFR